MHTDSVIQDLRIGLRVLIKEKSFCALAVAVLALGICAVTTMFAVVNAVMLRGLSFPTADRLVTANFIDPTTANLFGANGRTTSADYLELRGVQVSFERMTAYLNGSTVNMTIAGQPKRYTGVYATEDFLKCLGVAPFLGRDFTAADNTPGAEKVALIGYGLWQRDFGGRTDVVGTTVRLNGKPATIIGVMPQGFAFPTNEEVWIPLFSEFPPKDRKDPTATSPALFGVLKPGVTIDQATAELTTIARRYAAAYPDTNKAFNTGQVQPFVVAFTGPGIRGTLWVMLAFCGGVLLIACVNVMNMQFARATLRAKELAVRSSLGATRARLIRQMLTESLLLASIGAAVGIALAYGATGWLSTSVHNLDNPPPSWIVFDVDPKALIATVVCTVLAAIVSGLLPAWMSSRASTVGVLRDAGRGNTSRSVAWISRALVIFQIVVTCVLLIGALLQVRSIVKQGHIDYGYDTNGVLSARMGLMDGDYPTQEARKVFYDHLLARLSDVPEFGAVAFTNRFRMVFSGNGPIEIEGRQYNANASRPQANFEQVTPGFFEALSQHLLAGRNFTDQDLDARQPVAIINAAFAEKHFGHQVAVGQRFRTAAFGGAPAGPWRMIVGVVSTVRMLGPFNNPGVDDSGFYVPYYASPFGPLQTDPAVSQFATVVLQEKLNGDWCFVGKRVEVLNFGVAGYSTGQELLTLQQEVWNYHPDLVLLAFYPARDIANNVRELNNAADPERSPYFFDRGGQLVLDDSFRSLPALQPRQIALQNLGYQFNQHILVLQAVNALQRIGKLRVAMAAARQRAESSGMDNLEYAIYAPPSLPAMQTAWHVTEGLLLAMRDEVAAHGSGFRVVMLATRPQVIPYSAKRAELMRKLGVSDLSYADNRIQEFGEKANIPVIHLAPPLSAYAEEHQVYINGFNKSNWGAGHWNETGHRLAAEAIAADLCEKTKGPSSVTTLSMH